MAEDPMKILIIAQYFPPDITAAAFRMFDTARLLEAAGHEIRVITAYPHRSQAFGDTTAEYDRQLSRVLRTRVIPLKRTGAFGYILHYTSFMAGSVWMAVRQRLGRWRPDVVWASSPPLFAAVSGVAASGLYRVPLVLDIRDIWPDSAVGAGLLSSHGRAYRYAEKVERYVYDQAAHITCVARPMQEYIRTKTKTPVTVVYNGVRASDIASRAEEADGDESNHTLLYAGNLGRAQQLDLLIRAWANIRGRNGHHRWSIRFLGSGASEKGLKDLARVLGVSESVVFVPAVPRQEAIREMARAAALSITLRPDKVFEKTIPSKVFDCMAMGKPVLAGVGGEAREILESTGANTCYEPGNAEGLEKALDTLIREYSSLRQKARGNPHVIRTAYTREKAASILINVLESVTVARARDSSMKTGEDISCDGGLSSEGLSKEAPPKERSCRGTPG